MESAFQFTNPALVGLEFGLNDKFELNEDKEINTKVNMSVSVEKIDGTNEACVSLKVEIGGKEADAPFFITATEVAKFKWDDSLKAEMVDSLLNQNAPSLLLSYVRPIIAQITSASPFEAYNIPFINFTKKN